MRLSKVEQSRMAIEYGARDVERVVASVQQAIRSGDDPEATFASLKKSQPQLFGAKPKPAKPATALPHPDQPRKKNDTPERRNERRWQ